MTKYFIASKDVVRGVAGDDHEDMRLYTELGWELASSRLYINYLLQKGEIDKDNDVIVTNYDRQFLYSKHFKNVISYSDFVNNVQSSDIVEDLVPGLGEWIREMTVDIDMTQYKEEIYCNLINTDLDLGNIDDIVKNDDNFICLVVRKRSHCPHRSMPEESVDAIINFYKNNGFSVYIMGKDCENYDNGKNVFHVSYRDFATLINSEKCLKLITPLSGGGMIRFFTGICPTYVFLTYDEKRLNHLLYWGDGIDAFKNTFKDGKMHFVHSIEEILIEKFE